MPKTPVATPDMLNAIRAEAGADYQAAVPRATAANLAAVGNPIINYSATANAFLNVLVNKIVMTIVRRKIWTNPLQMLRKEGTPLGMDIEETHANPAVARDYNGEQRGMSELLQMNKPDVAVAFYRMNRQDKYTVTINNDQLTTAFTSWANLDNFVGQIVDTLYNGNTIDEFRLTKTLVSNAIQANQMPTLMVQMPVDTQTGKNFQIALRNLSMQMTFPSARWNTYRLMGGNTDRITWSDISDQLIIIRADVAANVGVEVLSAAFNLSYADYAARQIIVDNFDGVPNCLAVLCDVNAFEIREKLRRFENFFNPSALNWQYYYHAWDTFSLSPFYNCVAIMAAP